MMGIIVFRALWNQLLMVQHTTLFIQLWTILHRIGGTFRIPRAYEGKLLDDLNKEK